ncbi:MAG TPA: hypothetical protein VFA23_16290 [Dongiaceae bacterium]|nr:hypothetical protein [Dongiaceae bacterium]
MTFKTIDAILSEHERATTLVRFLPLMDNDESEVRELFMVRHLHQWCYQKDSKKTLNYKANVRGFLKRYVIGLQVDNVDYMKSWRADVFEFRVQLEPRRENTRMFGAFVAPDKFVAFHQKPRSEFGGIGDPKWDAAIDRVLDEFVNLFPGHRPVPARPFSNCVTSNYFDVFEA